MVASHTAGNASSALRKVRRLRLTCIFLRRHIVRYIGVGCSDTSSREAEWRTMFLVQEVSEQGHCERARPRTLECGTLQRALPAAGQSRHTNTRASLLPAAVCRQGHAEEDDPAADDQPHQAAVRMNIAGGCVFLMHAHGSALQCALNSAADPDVRVPPPWCSRAGTRCMMACGGRCRWLRRLPTCTRVRVGAGVQGALAGAESLGLVGSFERLTLVRAGFLWG